MMTLTYFQKSAPKTSHSTRRRPCLEPHASAWWSPMLIAFLGWVLLPSTGAAQTHGIEVSIRVAGGDGVGKISNTDNSDLTGVMDQVYPLWVDVGYRISDRFFVGAYGQLGYGTTGPELAGPCQSAPNLECHIHSHRLGLETHLHLAPHNMFDPWLGYGFGLEWLATSITDGTQESSFVATGFEFGNFQIGLDVQLTDHFFFGPVLSGSVGQYSNIERCIAGSCTDEHIEDGALHGWIVLGLRAGYRSSSVSRQ